MSECVEKYWPGTILEGRRVAQLTTRTGHTVGFIAPRKAYPVTVGCGTHSELWIVVFDGDGREEVERWNMSALERVVWKS